MLKKRTKKTTSSMPKFDPPLKPRYLTGEIDDLAISSDFKSYVNHRKRCATARPKIDNKPPYFNVDYYYKRETMNADAWMARSHIEDNLAIIKKLNVLSRLGGKVDCWNRNDRKYNTDQENLRADYERIEKSNRALYEKVNSLTSELSPKVMAEEWKILKKKIIEKSRYPWYSTVISRYPSIVTLKKKKSNDEQRKRCYFDLELASSNLPLGRIVFELYVDRLPVICANFVAFCRGYRGLSYKGTPLHRIISGYYCQGGDVTKFNGIGGATIHNDDGDEDKPTMSLNDEDMTLRHSCPGVLSTINERDSNDERSLLDSKFHLTFGPMRTMDGRNVVFGKIVKGLPILFKVEAYGTKYGKPLQRVVVANCGVLSETVVGPR